MSDTFMPVITEATQVVSRACDCSCGAVYLMLYGPDGDLLAQARMDGPTAEIFGRNLIRQGEHAAKTAPPKKPRCEPVH